MPAKPPKLLHQTLSQLPPLCLLRPDGPITQTQQKKAAPHTPRDEWIMSSATGSHLCNNRADFVDFKREKDLLFTNGIMTKVEGYGDTFMACVKPLTGEKDLVLLRNTAYAPGYDVNLVSYSKVQAANFNWNMLGNTLDAPDGTPVAKVSLCPTHRRYVFGKPPRV